MTKYDNPEVFIVLFGFLAILTLGALLGEVAVWVAKRFGFDDLDPTDFMARLEAGEVLDKDNMFG
tara:strand:+ start:288 stop:482 length:195 start_codon:yes stop_codon:yes gene_type:complete